MSGFQRSGRFPAPIAMACLLVLFACGCASKKALWNGRLGNYTYDQAILEYGPPDRSARLDDGTRVADWLTSLGYPGGYASFGYYYGYPYACRYPVPPAFYYAPPGPNYYLRLTFDPEGKLVAWKSVAR